MRKEIPLQQDGVVHSYWGIIKELLLFSIDQHCYLVISPEVIMIR